MGSGEGRWGRWKGLGGGRGVLSEVGETEVVEVGGGRAAWSVPPSDQRHSPGLGVNLSGPKEVHFLRLFHASAFPFE